MGTDNATFDHGRACLARSVQRAKTKHTLRIMHSSQELGAEARYNHLVAAQREIKRFEETL